MAESSNTPPRIETEAPPRADGLAGLSDAVARDVLHALGGLLTLDPSTRDDLARRIATASDGEALVRIARDIESAQGRPWTFPPESIKNEWTGEPPPREWLVPDWIPAGRVTLLTGPGGAGKSRLALQLAAAVALEDEAERDALPAFPVADFDDHAEAVLVRRPGGRPGRVLVVGWEDEHDETHRRLAWLDVDREALGDRLHHVDASRYGPLWGVQRDKHESTRGDVLGPGSALARIVRAENAEPWRLAILDPVAAAYGANENARAVVREYVSWCATELTARGCAVLILAHPPFTPGKDYSGSTDWRNGVRSVMTIARAEHADPEAERELAEAVSGGGDPKAAAKKAKKAKKRPYWCLHRGKANYAREGDAVPLALIWDPGSRQAGAERARVLRWAECDIPDALEAHEAYRRGERWPPA